MYIGAIVYRPFKDAYIKYVIKKMFDNEIIVVTIKTHISDWLNKKDVITSEQFNKIYNNEIIYE